MPLTKALRGVLLDDSNVLLQAVLAGQGVGLGIVGFIGDELASGRLSRPFPLAVDPGDAYWLVASERSLRNEAVRRVRSWLLASRT